MNKGGYVLIDCTGLDLTLGSTEQTIDGLFKRLDDAMKYNVELKACNCDWDGKLITPISCFAIKYADDLIIATASTLQIHVTDEDVVTIVNMAPSSEE